MVSGINHGEGRFHATASFRIVHRFEQRIACVFPGSVDASPGGIAQMILDQRILKEMKLGSILMNILK